MVEFVEYSDKVLLENRDQNKPYFLLFSAEWCHWCHEFAENTLFVVYCAGPHCNGSTRAALRLAQLGRPVKEMIGGITGWLDEGFDLVGTEAGG